MQAGRDIISALSGIIAFFLVFNLFYTVMPYPFMISTVEDVYNFQPKAYTHPADEPDKLIAKANSWRGYKVIEYWYHWPYDGHELRDDWEPVIILIDGDDVKVVAHRIHYNWRLAFTFPKDGVKPVVTFAALWHTPYLKDPPEDWVEVGIKPVIGEPPENVDYDELFGVGVYPSQSAIAAAVIYATLAAFAMFFISYELIS